VSRLGLISYLNTAPFRFGLKRLGHAPWTEALPSQMFPLVESGEVEAAIMPSFDVLSHPELVALPGTGIACVGKAYSVKLFHRVPLRFAESVALDTSSHTSAGLARIILDSHGAHPKFVEAAPDLPRMLASADVALLIGDPCLQADASGLLVTDVGEEWHRLTGLPFVFALWGARPGADGAGLSAMLKEAVDIGLANLEAVAEEEAGRAGLAPESIVEYLRDYMRYHLDDAVLAGLERYRQLLVAQKLIADTGPVHFTK
jgi:predicted solute-binding protein